MYKLSGNQDVSISILNALHFLFKIYRSLMRLNSIEDDRRDEVREGLRVAIDRS